MMANTAAIKMIAVEARVETAVTASQFIDSLFLFFLKQYYFLWGTIFMYTAPPNASA
jgi:hypothetical protein